MNVKKIILAVTIENENVDEDEKNSKLFRSDIQFKK